MDRYQARSASDKTDNWPYWYVEDTNKGGLNVTVSLVPELRGRLPFVSQRDAKAVAIAANEGET